MNGEMQSPSPNTGEETTANGHNVPREEAGTTSPEVASGGSLLRPADPRPWCAVDWSRGLLHLTLDGESVTTVATVEDLPDLLVVPHRIAAESTFESWDPARRGAMAALLRSRGHEILVFRPIHTARNRTEGKSDTVDVKVIYRVATTGKLHLYPLPDPDTEWAARRLKANRDYQRMRLDGRKTELQERAESILGPYQEQTEQARRVLGSGRNYSPSLLAVVMFAAELAATRAEFERLLGLHGSAYPTLLRSEVHHHSFRHAKKRGVTWREYRRELRTVYRRIRDDIAGKT